MARATMSMERVTVRDDRRKRRSDLSELVAVDGRYAAECRPSGRSHGAART